MTELWKQIKDFPNYNISNFGNIKNIITNKTLKQCIKSGYYNISLINKNNIKKSKTVHRLVALEFIDNHEKKPEVNHKDKNKLNNHIDNLEWMTKIENNIHRCKDAIITTNKNKQLHRINKLDNTIIQIYNSIEDASIWAFENGLTKNTHNGRNSIGNCVCGLSHTAYGFKWEIIKPKDILTDEIWKQVVIENNNTIKNTKQYFVSNLGRFKNSKGIIMDNYKINDNGYIRVYIYHKTYALHRLIALTFLENNDNKEQVNHIDGCKTNNCLNNLEWVTNRENQIHKFKTGLGNNFTRKIGQYSVENIFIREFNSIVSAAKELDISKSGISGVLKEKRKTAGGFIWKYLD
jgi:hypothetical protein